MIDSEGLAEMEYYAYIQLDADGYGTVDFNGDAVDLYWAEDYFVAEDVAQDYIYSDGTITLVDDAETIMVFYRTDHTGEEE